MFRMLQEENRCLRIDGVMRYGIEPDKGGQGGLANKLKLKL